MNSTENSQSRNKDKSNLIDHYQIPEKIYTRSFTGFYRKLRISGGLFLFVIFFGTGWLNWGSRQIILFDLGQRKFHIFGTTFWPQDFLLLSWLLIICAFSLFVITIFAGRIWCGYACPQSVFTWVFMWVERVIEGERNKRIKEDKQPFSIQKLYKKIAKHFIWLIIGFATAYTFVGYFTPVRELILELMSWQVGPWVAFWLAFFTLATYGNAGWLREQVCLHMCPYARFQSVMFDNNTLVVAYDDQRGEVRGPRKRSVDPKTLGLGDCIDCTLCVQVCPTGIDIRNGLQYQCIGCAACIDACDSIMDKIGYKKGLVRYTTATELAGGKTSFIRVQLLVYIVALLVILSGFFWTIIQRVPLELDIIRDRNTLYRILDNGYIENIYIVKIANKSNEKLDVSVSVKGINNIRIIEGSKQTIMPGEISEEIIKVIAPFIKGRDISRVIEFQATSAGTLIKSIKSESRFIIPSTNSNNDKNRVNDNKFLIGE